MEGREVINLTGLPEGNEGTVEGEGVVVEVKDTRFNKARGRSANPLVKIDRTASPVEA